MHAKPVVGAVRPQASTLTRVGIAGISNCVMAHLDRSELIAIVQYVAEHIPQPGWADAIDQCDDGTLLRMAFRARECCRHLLENEQAFRSSNDCCEDNCGCPHCG